jgi:adhesin transport system outer membrane protein
MKKHKSNSNKNLNLFVITIILLTLTLAPFTQGLSPTKEEPLTIKQAVSMALERNHQVLIARNTATITKNNAHVGNANLLPTVTLSASTNYQDIATATDPSSSNSSSAFQESTTTNSQVQVTYTLYDGFGNIYRYKKLQAGSDLGEIEARNAIESTLLQVSSAFYSAASAYENLLIANQLVSISEERLKRAKKRSAYGQARTIDVLSAQVDYLADQVTVTQATFLWNESRRNLNLLLDRDIQKQFTITTTVNIKKSYLPDQLKALALSRNSSYLASQKRLLQSGYDLKIARSLYLPRLDFSGSFGYSQTAPNLKIGFSNSDPALRLGATLSFNLFNGYQTTIQNKNAILQNKNQELSLAQTLLILEKDVISSYESFKNSLLVLDLQKKYVEAAELNFKRTKELYNLGQLTTTQFREAQLNLIRSRSNMATAKYEAKIKEIELLRLTGQLLQNKK